MAASKQEEANGAKLVQLSMAKANNAIQRGDKDEAVKLLRSTDQLCDRLDAPPPVHALVTRMLGDLLRKQATSESYAEARALMIKVVGRLEASEYRAGIPKEIQMDLRARMGDLLASWGELEREAGDCEASIQALSKGVAAFKRMGNAYEYMAATQNRLAVSYIEAGDGAAALTALKRAEEYAESVPQHQDQLMQQTVCHRGSAYARLEQNERAVEEFNKALDMAHATGNEELVSEIESRLTLLDAAIGAAKATSSEDMEAAYL